MKPQKIIQPHIFDHGRWNIEMALYLGYDPVKMIWLDLCRCEVVGNVYENARLLEF
ncbi:YopX family protein [Bacillus cereus]